jgi:hypothetical protein
MNRALFAQAATQVASDADLLFVFASQVSVPIIMFGAEKGLTFLNE